MTVTTTTTATATPSKALAATKAPTTATAKRAPTAKKPAPIKAKRVTVKKAAPVKAKRAAPSKVTQAAAPAKVAQSAAPAKAKNKKEVVAPVAKDKKVKVVRDSFTIPKNEFVQLAEMKKKALGLGMDIKKSELLRAGLMLLSATTDTAFKKALSNVPTLKTGRPGKA
jgi:hypothetical protein